MQTFPRSAAFLLSASVLALGGAGCSNPTTGPGNDTGTSGVDSGSAGHDSGALADTGGSGTDSGAASADSGASTTDSGASTTDSGGSTTDSGSTSADAGTDGGASASGCVFHGRYVATNIRCNGVAYTGAAALTPPSGGWYASDDGTTATFTQTIGTCSLVATGHIACDSPMAGQFTHTPSAPLACNPTACSPFAAACSGSAVGATATWSYTVNGDGSIEAATVGTTPIRTCTASGQSNPVQITWVPAP